jgi:hypothetical protein
MLDLNEEKKFAELKEICQYLKMPAPPEIFIRMQVHDKKGDLVFDNKERGHSWTRNFWNFMFAMLTTSVGGNSNNFGAGYLSEKSTNGTIRYTSNYGVNGHNYNPGAGTGFIRQTNTEDAGIVVGTGDTAFSIDQFVLSAVIAHGNNAGQLYYAAMSPQEPIYTAVSKTWKNIIKRLFNNNSGESITVKETGLYFLGYFFSSSYEGNMLERSVLASAVNVPNGAQLTVTYEISMDFSAID